MVSSISVVSICGKYLPQSLASEKFTNVLLARDVALFLFEPCIFFSGDRHKEKARQEAHSARASVQECLLKTSCEGQGFSLVVNNVVPIASIVNSNLLSFISAL